MLNPLIELRHAARRLRRAPAFTVATIVVLTLGVGATVAAFSIINGVILRPLPFAAPDQLVAFHHAITLTGLDHVEQSEGTFLTYQRHKRTLSSMGVYREDEVNLALGAGEASEAERVQGARVSVGLLPTLGATALVGRLFDEGEDRANAARVVVVSEDYWRTHLGADRGVVGRTLLIDGFPSQVVGVLPRRFQFPSPGTQLWRPEPFDLTHVLGGNFLYRAVGRLRPGMTAAMAAADLDRIRPQLFTDYATDVTEANFKSAGMQAVVRPLQDTIVGDSSRVLWILFGTAAMLLVIACANAASLFLVRMEARQRELAVRSALGAAGLERAAPLVSEAILLSATAGALGVALAWATVRGIRALPAGVTLPRAGEVTIDARVLAAAVLTTVATALAISLLPLWRGRRVALASTLRDAGRANTTGARQHRARNALVVAQVAVGLVLVTGAGLMLRSFVRLRGVQPGFVADHALTMRLALPSAKYRGAVAQMQFYDALTQRVSALPGVRTVAISQSVPLVPPVNHVTVEEADHPLPAGGVAPARAMINVTGSAFDALGIPLLAGRSFGAIDPAQPPLEAVITRTYADAAFKGQSALGKRVRVDPNGPWFTIVGVVGDVHQVSLEQPADPTVYLPLVMPAIPPRTGFQAPSSVAILVRTAGDPSALIAPVRAAVHALDPTLPTFREQPLGAVLDAAAARTRFTMLLIGTAGVIALVLGAVGIYGVMAYSVSLRQREIGVRLALGAEPADVRRMVSRQGMALAGLGAGVGLVAAVGITRFMRGVLYDVSAGDPMTLAAATTLLLAVGLVASWLPARRASRVDPAVALRRD